MSQVSVDRVFELVVFDWDGTLMDSEAHIVSCLQRSATDVGLEAIAASQASNVIGLGLREAFIQLFPDIRDTDLQALIDRYRVHFFTDDPCEPFEGAENVLQNLEGQGYLLAVATGKGRNGLNRVLNHTGFGRYFAATRCAEETCSKPDPQMLHELMALLDVAPEKTLMIGDTEYDLHMARAAGTAALGVDYGVHGRDRLIACEPLDCLSSIMELPKWLKEHSKRAA